MPTFLLLVEPCDESLSLSYPSIRSLQRSVLFLPSLVSFSHPPISILQSYRNHTKLTNRNIQRGRAFRFLPSFSSLPNPLFSLPTNIYNPRIRDRAPDSIFQISFSRSGFCGIRDLLLHAQVLQIRIDLV